MDEDLYARERDCMLLQILDLHGSSFLRDQLSQMLTDAGVPIYNSGGGSISLAGRIQTYFGWRARYEGPAPFGFHSEVVKDDQGRPIPTSEPFQGA